MTTKQKHLAALLGILKILQTVDPGFPLPYALCLLEIGQDEGLSLTLLAKKTNMQLSTISRIVGALSCDHRHGKGYGLIRVDTAPEERRRKKLHLTPRGRSLINSLMDSLPLSR